MSSVEGETISHRKTNKKQVLQYLQLWTMKLCFQVRLTSLPVLGSFKDWKVLLSSVHRYVTGNAAIGPYRKYQINTYIKSSQASDNLLKYIPHRIPTGYLSALDILVFYINVRTLNTTVLELYI